MLFFYSNNFFFTFQQAELDEMAAEARLCEDKAAKAMVDAARLADELRAEQDAAQHIEKERRLLEAQAKDMHQRLDDAETNALKGGKKAMNKVCYHNICQIRGFFILKKNISQK